VSAILAAARLIVEIEKLAGEFAQETHSFFDPAYTTLNIGTIQGGTAKNIVAGSCRFQLEWRPIPGQPATAVLDSVTALVTKMEREDRDFRAEVRPIRQQGSFETGESAPLVRSLEALTGRSAVSIPFGSEASVFGRMADEIVVIGPGDMRTAHSSRECVPIAELHEAVECLSALMHRP
jgi:acetylornithine deacetylase